MVADGKTYETQTVIVATGAVGERLNVPGEDEFEMHGLCYSAMTYAPADGGSQCGCRSVRNCWPCAR